ncbi:hypothetical protein AB7M35_003440 [Amorphus suaedae]
MNSLHRNWLAVELESIDEEIEDWGDGLKESFRSLFPQQERLVGQRQECDSAGAQKTGHRPQS